MRDARQPLPSVQDVAAAIIKSRPGIDQMQLHKLLYLVQAAHLAWLRRPAFEGPLQAWKYGPVALRVAGTYMEYGREPIPAPLAGDSEALGDETKWVVRRVIELFGHKSGVELARITKERPASPWRVVRADLPDDEPSEAEIPVGLIADFHRKHGLEPIGVSSDEKELLQRFEEGDVEALAELAERVTGARPRVN